MNIAPKISVIMLTYNRENMVSVAIESVLNQTFCDFEYIIIDNGSTDSSGIIADEYALKDNRIKVVHKDRGNIGSGRNAGLDLACGEYIAFIDDDDYCETDFLDFLYRLASENNSDVAICGAADKNFNEKHIMNAEQAIIALMWRRLYNMAFPTKLFLASLMSNLRFPEEGLYDDIAIMYRLLAGAKSVAYHGLPKYTFNRHDSNNSAWTTNHSLLTLDSLNEYIAAYRVRTDWLSKIFPSSADAFRYFEWSFMISMVEKISRLNLHECYGRRDELIRAIRSNRVEFLNSNYIQSFEQEWVARYCDE